MVEEEVVKRVVDNAKIEITEEELEKFTEELNDTLEVFEKIEEVDTDSVEPSFHPLDLGDRSREDKVKESLGQEEALKNTKNKEDGYFKGPKIV